MKKHELKSRPEFFAPLCAGWKTFEIRIDDRGFQPHDEVVLREWDDTNGYTGRRVEGVIQYITTFEQKPGYIVFSVGVRRMLQDD